MSNGHSWSSIQKYSLAEVGIFFKLIIELEREEKKENLINTWMGSNLEYKGLNEVLSTMGLEEKKEEISVKEVKSEWKRLASFMGNIK